MNQTDLIAVLRRDIIAVVERHVAVDRKKVQVRVDRGDAVSRLEVGVEIPNTWRYGRERSTRTADHRASNPAKRYARPISLSPLAGRGMPRRELASAGSEGAWMPLTPAFSLRSKPTSPREAGRGKKVDVAASVTACSHCFVMPALTQPSFHAGCASLSAGIRLSLLPEDVDGGDKPRP